MYTVLIIKIVITEKELDSIIENVTIQKNIEDSDLVWIPILF